MKDLISDILETIALRASVYFLTDFRPPFGVQVPAFSRAARFHLIIKGQCHVRLDDGSHRMVQEGDLVLVPNGRSHVLASADGAPVVPLTDVVADAGFDGSGALIAGAGAKDDQCTMVCGHFSFADGAEHPLLRAMPDLLHIPKSERGQRPMLDGLVSLIAQRMVGGTAGTAASVNRLSEALFVEIIHAGCDAAPELARVMAAAHHPQIGRALALIHDDVGAPWTVEMLADKVAMSRSSFASHFREHIGMTPIAYLSEWRLQRARHLLSLRVGTVKAIANQVGYRSAAAFSRAFSERFGMSPDQHIHGAEDTLPSPSSQ